MWHVNDYLSTCRDAFAQASHMQPLHEHALQIADVTIKLLLAGPALEPFVLPAVTHLRTDVSEVTADITFHLWDVGTTGIVPPRPPFTLADYKRYGQRAIARVGAVNLMHAPTVGQLFLYDRERKHGYFCVDSVERLSIYERAAPVQSLFYWALEEYGWQVIHAAAVGTEQGGVLLIGGSGAGKSTTALSCLTGNGIGYLSDDKCLARLTPAPQAFALFNSAKMKEDMLQQLPHFRPHLAAWDGSGDANKGLMYLYPAYQRHMLRSFLIKALVLPQVTQQALPSIRPTSAATVFRHLGPSTVIWLPGAESQNYRFTSELARSVPCFQLDLAVEPQRNVDAIAELLKRF